MQNKYPAVLVIIVCVFVFIGISFSVLNHNTYFIDEPLQSLVYLIRNPFMTKAMEAITFLGSVLFIEIAVILIIISLMLLKKTRDAAIFLSVLLFSVFFYEVLKNFFQRARPPLPLVHETSFSFPSGHSMNSLVFYGCLSFFVFLKLKNKRLGIALTIAAFLLVVLIGISRIYLGVHYPSDIIGGFSMGLAVFLALVIVESATRKPNNIRSSNKKRNSNQNK